MDPIQCGQFIQQLRKERRLTQTELADLLQVTNKAISRWETGEGFPDVMILPKLSSMLGVTVDEILHGERIVKKEQEHSSQKRKLLNIALVSKTVYFASYLIFFTLTYTIYQIWLPFALFLIPSIFAFMFLTIERNNYMSTCSFDEQDKKILSNTKNSNLLYFSVLFSMSIPQIIAVTILNLPDESVNGILNMTTFVMLAGVLGFLTFLFLQIWFIFQAKKSNIKTTTIEIDFGYIFGMIAFGLSFTIVHPNLFGYTPLVFYAVCTVIHFMEKKLTLRFFIYRIIVSLLIATALFIIELNDSMILYCIGSIIILFILGISIFLFIMLIVKKQSNSYFWMSYHNVLLIGLILTVFNFGINYQNWVTAILITIIMQLSVVSYVKHLKNS